MSVGGSKIGKRDWLHRVLKDFGPCPVTTEMLTCLPDEVKGSCKRGAVYPVRFLHESGPMPSFGDRLFSPGWVGPIHFWGSA